jgi:hypothetical protein
MGGVVHFCLYSSVILGERRAPLYIGATGNRSGPRQTIPQPFFRLDRSGTAICQGAVLFGLDPSIISERTSRKTYGILCAREFRNSDPEEKKWFHAERGCFYISGSFHIFVRNGDQVRSFLNYLSVKLEFLALTTSVSFKDNIKVEYKAITAKPIGLQLQQSLIAGLIQASNFADAVSSNENIHLDTRKRTDIETFVSNLFIDFSPRLEACKSESVSTAELAI